MTNRKIIGWRIRSPKQIPPPETPKQQTPVADVEQLLEWRQQVQTVERENATKNSGLWTTEQPNSNGSLFDE